MREANDALWRWLNAAHQLIYKQGEDKDEAHPEFWTNVTYEENAATKKWIRGFLESHEINALRGIKKKCVWFCYDRPTLFVILLIRPGILYKWCTQLLLALQEKQYISNPDRIVKLLMDQNDHVDTIFMYLNTPLPYSYAHLMALLTKIHVLLFSLVFGTWIGDGLSGRTSWSEPVLAYVFFVHYPPKFINFF